MTQHAPAIFLNGILMPAQVRYAPLLAALGDEGPVLTTELDVLSWPESAAGYSFGSELDALDRFADDHGLERFHLYGYSAGGSVAMAYVAARPGRAISLAVDEPATDFSDEDRRAIAAWRAVDVDLPVPERMERFVRSNLRPGVEVPPPPPSGPDTGRRIQALGALGEAFAAHDFDRAGLRSFAGPTYFSYGSLSSQRFEDMAERLVREQPRCTVDRFEAAHHFRTSHLAEPTRVATALRRLWSEAEVG